jgi:hypothetical protein
LSNPLRITGPRYQHKTEANANEERLLKRKEFKGSHDVMDRIRYEQSINRLRVYEAKRAALGRGTAQVEPYMEASLPYSMLASALCLKLSGVFEGEAIEMLPENAPFGAITPPERVWVHKFTPFTQDFNIPKGRVVRFRLRQRRMLIL